MNVNAKRYRCPKQAWYLYCMVTQNMLRAHEIKWDLSQKKNLFVTSLDLSKYLKQIKEHRFLLTCAPISELPSTISTMQPRA